MKLINKNIRIVIAFTVMVIALFFNKNFFVDYTITSAECRNEGCGQIESGNISGGKPIIEQLVSEKKFEQLKRRDEKIILGQIFQQNDELVMTGVVFDIDVTKIDNRGGKKYKLVLKGVKKNDKKFEFKKGSLASLEFTVDEIENYRQEDGKIRFPIYAELEKENHYFVGIDKEKIKTDKFNYLTLKGAGQDSYANGTAAVKIDDKTYKLDGDLYFKILAK